MNQKKSNTVYIICCTGILIVLFCLLPMWVFAAEVKLVKLDRETKKIKLTLESDRPISYQFDLDETTRKFSVGLQGADFYLALTEFFQNLELEGLSQCLEEIAIVPVSNDEATLEVMLGQGMNGSVYDDTANSPKNFRLIIQFVAVANSNAPCFSGATMQAEREPTIPPVVPFVESVIAAKQVETTSTRSSVLSDRKFSAFFAGDFLALKNKGGLVGDEWLVDLGKNEIREAQIKLDGLFGDWVYALAARSYTTNLDEKKFNLYRAWSGYTGIEQWQFKLGLQREPFGIEGDSEIDSLPFMEKSLVSNISPSFGPGFVMTYLKPSGFRWDVGTFGQRSKSDDPLTRQSLNTRIGFTPYKDKTTFALANLSLSRSKPVDDRVVYTANPESHLIAPLFSIDETGIESISTTGVSLFLSSDSLSMMLDVVDSKFAYLTPPLSTQSQKVSAQSLWVSWFLTGEQRRIKQGVMQRVIPNKLIGSSGWGAWESALRYSHLSDDQDQSLSSLTFGVNWYLNTYVALKANWVFATQSVTTAGGVDNDADIIEIRLQLNY